MSVVSCVAFLLCFLHLVVSSYKSHRSNHGGSNRLIQNQRNHYHVVQVHPKHRVYAAARAEQEVYQNHHHAVQIHPKHSVYAAAKAEQELYQNEFEMEMGLSLGAERWETAELTFSGTRKRTRCKNTFKDVAKVAHGGNVEDAGVAKRIEDHSAECYKKCNEKYENDFDPFAECFASCWYVADGNVAATASAAYRSPDWRPRAHPRSYQKFMTYLYRAAHRVDRFGEIKRLYAEQQKLLKAKQWNGYITDTPWITKEFKSVIDRMNGGKLPENTLFLWRGMYDIELDPTAIINEDETGKILWGPASCSTGLVTPYQAASQGLVGTILRIEVPVNVLDLDNAARGGKDVAWFKKNFGLIDMFHTDYADNQHKKQREVMLYTFPSDWMKVEAVYAISGFKLL